MKDFVIVTACTPDYLKKLQWTIPTWVLKPQFKGKKLFILNYGFKNVDEFNFVKPYFDYQLIEVKNENNLPQRELMLSSFIFYVDIFNSDYFVKLDADTYFTNNKDVFSEEDFEYDIVSHRWGYTKPGYWIDVLNNYFYKKSNTINYTNEISKQNRIQSFCCLHKKEFVLEIKNMCYPKLPVPSHDTTLWYFAEHMENRKWAAKNMHKVGVGHCARFLRMRDDICSNESAFNNYLNKELFKKIQLEVTNYCQIGCTNCDRNCGIVRRNNFMSIPQIWNFVEESINLNHKWERIDIIGGEPTYYPQLGDLFNILEIYKNKFPDCKFRFSTNGYGNYVKSTLEKIPTWVHIRNSERVSAIQSGFDAYNSSPIDNGEKEIKYCSIPWRCGLALTRYGYFPCGAGASLCEIFGKDIGIKNLKNFTIDKVIKQLKEICIYCGHSNCKTKHFVNKNEISESWANAIKNYNENKMSLY